jgi:AraC-like DNA-binding protein
MFDPSDRRLPQARADSANSLTRSGRIDADLAIRMLGAKANRQVPTATALHFGQWLGWPDWLRDGTSLTDPGPLPPTVSLADDLIIVGNIIDRSDSLALVKRMLTSPRPAMGTIGALTLMHAPDLGQALNLLVRAMTAQNPFIVVRLDECDREDMVEVAFLPQWPMGPLFQFSAIVGLTLIYRAIESLHGNDLGAMTLETGLHGLPEVSGLLAEFGCRISPARKAECLRFPRNWLATANLHHDEMLWAVARTKIHALEDTIGEPAEVSAIRAFISEMVLEKRRVPRLKQAAAHLGVSTRTIIRSLARQETSFHKLVEEERKAGALALLADSSLRLTEVANALGFSDVSSFGRSVRKWFGESPGNLRKQSEGRDALRQSSLPSQSLLTIEEDIDRPDLLPGE